MGQIHFENVTVVMDSKNIIYRYHQHLFSDKYNNKYTHSTIYGKYNGLYLYLYNMNLNFFQIFIFLCFSGIDICQKNETTASSGRIRCTITIRQPLDTKITFTFAVMDIGAKCTYLTCSKGPRGQLT